MDWIPVVHLLEMLTKSVLNSLIVRVDALLRVRSCARRRAACLCSVTLQVKYEKALSKFHFHSKHVRNEEGVTV